MNPGQLVYDRKRRMVVEIIEHGPGDLCWIRPLGRKYISMRFRARHMWLASLHHEVTSWIAVVAETGCNPSLPLDPRRVCTWDGVREATGWNRKSRAIK